MRNARLALSGIPFHCHLLPHDTPKNDLLPGRCRALLSTGTILLRVMMSFAVWIWAARPISTLPLSTNA